MRVIVVLVVWMVSACQKKEMQEPDPVEVRRAINQANGQYITAYEKGQATVIASLYAPDATVVQPNIEPVRGRDRIEKEFIQLFNQSRFKDVRIQTQDVRASGSMAYEYGKYSLTVSPMGLTPATLNGNYVVVWQLQPDGIWKILLELRQPNI